MLNTMNVIEIMRLTDAVYESDTLTIGQNLDSFTEIGKPSLKKRYIKFATHNPHTKYQSILKHNLENLGNGDAVITMQITEKNGQFILSDKGFKSATFVDLSKVTDNELMILKDLVGNTLKKNAII